MIWGIGTLTFWNQKRNPARELALIGVQKRKATVFEVAQQMRREKGLPPHPVFEGQR